MAVKRSRGPPRLPVKQLGILAICRFAEPVSMTSVFPYLPEMIESFGVTKREVAKWAGITSAVFSISQCLTAVLWGRASDKFGRKPVILTSLTCTMLLSLIWGMSSSLPMAIVSRAMSGGCNGNVGIIRTMVAEMVPEKELQPRAFSVMPMVWSLGSTLGPSLGGFFAKPAENLSGIFGDNKLLIKFPFLLPNIIASTFFLIGITTGILFLQETLETKRHKKDPGRILGQRLVAFFGTLFHLDKRTRSSRHQSAVNETSPLLRPPSSANSDSSKAFSDSFTPKSPKPPVTRPTLSEVFTRQSVINLAAYSILALHSGAYDQLVPIFLHHPREDHDPSNTHLPFKFSGGFGLASGRIGTIFTLYGVFGGLMQFFFFPPVARRLGVLRCFKLCAVTFPIVYFITPYTALIEDPAWQQAVMVCIMLVKCFAGIFAFPCSTVLLTNSATSLRILGTLNGFAVSISAVGRALGPFMTGTSFTWGLKIGYVVTAWWFLAFMALLGAIPVWYLVEMEGFSKTADNTDDEEEEDEGPETPIGEHILDNDRVANPNHDDETDTAAAPLPLNGNSTTKSRDIQKAQSPKRESSLERNMSSPIGILGGSVGPGGGRRLSNGLAASNNGYGTGGTSFH